MARPIKDTIDYFPHECEHRRTMFIIEQKYGNEGYAFWFKLLELLGKTPKHIIDCNNDTTWEFLQAKTRQSNGFCDEILGLLAKVDAIDSDLWQNYRVIWCQNFVNGIADVYKKRQRPIPKRPNYHQKRQGKGVSGINNITKEGLSGDKTDKVN